MVQIMQRMLCDHGVFPHEILKLPMRELFVIHALMDKESKELQKMSKK